MTKFKLNQRVTTMGNAGQIEAKVIQTPVFGWMRVVDDHGQVWLRRKNECKPIRLARVLRASLADEDERADTLAAYAYLAEWEAGQHRGDDEYNVGDHLRLRRSHRVPQTQE